MLGSADQVVAGFRGSGLNPCDMSLFYSQITIFVAIHNIATDGVLRHHHDDGNPRRRLGHDDCDGDDDDGEMMINRPGAAIRPLSLLLT